MERNLQDVTFVVVDLETTGGAPFGSSEITEFGAVKVRGGEVIGEFSTFVKTDGAIPQFIVEMTGGIPIADIIAAIERAISVDDDGESCVRESNN